MIEGLSYGILTPVFFSFAGLQVRLHEMTDWGFFAVILGTAVVGKVAGAYIGGRIGGFKRIECLAIGIGMNARGSMEVVLALLGLSAGIISQQLFSIIVMMAMITSLMTPPLLRLLAPFIPLGEDELSRMRHEAQEARAMFKKKDLKFLVPTTGGPNGAAILGMVAPLIKSGRAAITLLFVRAPGKSIKEKLIKFFRKDEQSVELQASVERLKELAKERGVAVAPKIVTSSERAEAVLDEARQGCDLLILGAYSPSDPFGGEFLEPVVAGSPAHVAVFRGTAELPKNFRKILLPTKGDALFPAVFEFAAMLAEHDPEASITVLYAATRAGHAKRRWNPLSLLLGAQAEPIDAGDSMAKLVAESIEAHASSTDHKLKVELRSVKGDSAAQAILEEARAGGYDLLLMGATKHLVRERLFFGHTVDEIALQAPCPVVAFTPKGEGVMRA